MATQRSNKNKVEITLRRSPIGCPMNQRSVVRSLGLRKVNHTVTHDDSPQIRGMINKVSHLLSVKPL
jgi:large subunit ribosomal protein L30